MIGNITLDLIDDMGRVMRLPLAVNPSADEITNPQDGDFIFDGSGSGDGTGGTGGGGGDGDGSGGGDGSGDGSGSGGGDGSNSGVRIYFTASTDGGGNNTFDTFYDASKFGAATLFIEGFRLVDSFGHRNGNYGWHAVGPDLEMHTSGVVILNSINGGNIRGPDFLGSIFNPDIERTTVNVIYPDGVSGHTATKYSATFYTNMRAGPNDVDRYMSVGSVSFETRVPF